MNFERLWYGRKQTLLDTISAGKNAEAEKKLVGYSEKLYDLVKDGEHAAEELIEMDRAEVEQYFGNVAYADSLDDTVIIPASEYVKEDSENE